MSEDQSVQECLCVGQKNSVSEGTEIDDDGGGTEKRNINNYKQCRQRKSDPKIILCNDKMYLYMSYVCTFYEV